MPSAALAPPPPIFEGDILDSAEFLRRWEAQHGLKFAELINGTVFMPSPLALDHGATHNILGTWLGVYQIRTPGCQAGNDTTWVMGPKDVPQPDIHLRILPEFGGQSTRVGKYGAGAPELIVEVSGSSRSRDLGVKLELYLRMGVREYITAELPTRKITWRVLSGGRYQVRRPGPDGLLRSRVFPGLWLGPKAVWDGNVLDALERGVASPGHSAFARRLTTGRTAAR